MTRKCSTIPDKWKTKGCNHWRLRQPNSPHPFFSAAIIYFVTVHSNCCVETLPKLSWFCLLCSSFTALPLSGLKEQKPLRYNYLWANQPMWWRNNMTYMFCPSKTHTPHTELMNSTFLGSRPGNLSLYQVPGLPLMAKLTSICRSEQSDFLIFCKILL